MNPCKTFTFCVLALLCAPSWAAKTDIVILNNGDRITGDIKKLEAGLLEFFTDTMGMVYIEWRFITEVLSDKQHTVETTDGNRWLGRLQKPAEGEGIELQTGRGSIQIRPEDMVQAWPVEATFWDKLDLDISAGLDYANSTEISNFNFALDASYMTEIRLVQVTARSYNTHQPEGEDQSRNSLTGMHQYLLPGRNFRATLGGAETNEALGVNLRLYVGGGVGRYFTKSEDTWFSGLVGLLANQENPKQAGSEVNFEAVTGLRYRRFRFASPERNLDAQLLVFPSITDFGRVRADFRTTFKFEIIRDLFWALEVYSSYDSDPLSLNADKSDYGITTSIGWTH